MDSARPATIADYERLYVESNYGLTGTGLIRRRWFVTQVRVTCPPPATVLDVGCGRGLLLRELGAIGYTVTGCEAAAACEHFAGDAYPFVLAELPDLSAHFADGSFDVVTCNDVLEHLPDEEAVHASIAELARITRRHAVISAGRNNCVMQHRPGAGPMQLHLIQRSHGWWTDALAHAFTILDADEQAQSSFFLVETD